MTLKRLDYDADNFSSAEQYFKTRELQLKHLGVNLLDLGRVGDVAVKAIFEYDDRKYASYYVLTQFRGRGLMGDLLSKESLAILTTKDCHLEGYLNKAKPKGGYLVLNSEILDSIEYKMIQNYYGDKRAKRSGVFLMNHIDEGIAIMAELGASLDAMKAYCVHPIFQPDDALENNIHLCEKLSQKVILLTMEYRNKANRYLCRPHTDHLVVSDLDFVVGPLLLDVKHMLVADKKQNQKDFNLYHRGTHKRSKELGKYFENWISWLESL